MKENTRLAADVVAVIVDWKRADLTDRCIRSILAGSLVPGSIVVVENESTAVGELACGSNDTELPAHGQMQVVRVRSSSNRGYAGGINLGIEVALQFPSRALVLINNDVIVDHSCIEILCGTFERHGAAIVGGRCLSETGGMEVGYARRWPTALWGRGAEKTDNSAVLDCFSTDIVDGALWLVSRDCLERSMEYRGFFLDPLYFLYWEDADLCMFARRQRMNCVFEPQATARHSVAASSGGLFNVRGLYYQSRNVILFTCRWSSPLELVLYLPLVVLHRLAALLKHIVGGRRSQARAVAIGIWHAFRGTRWKFTRF